MNFTSFHEMDKADRRGEGVSVNQLIRVVETELCNEFYLREYGIRLPDSLYKGLPHKSELTRPKPIEEEKEDKKKRKSSKTKPKIQKKGESDDEED